MFPQSSFIAGSALILSPAPILDVMKIYENENSKIGEPFMETNRIIRITFKSMKSTGENFREQENISKGDKWKCMVKVVARGSKSGFQQKRTKNRCFLIKLKRCMNDFDNIMDFCAF